jgi:transposase
MILQLPDLKKLTPEQKDNLILELWALVQVQREQIAALTKRVEAQEREIAALRAKLGEPPKTPDNSSVPPSRGQQANTKGRVERSGLRQGSISRKGGGRPLARNPDETIIAKAKRCCHCEAELSDEDQKLHSRHDKIEIPPVKPIVTRVERYAGHCPCCHGVTLAPVPQGMEEGSPFSPSILALALYLRFTHAISYKRLCQLFLHLFALPISEGALDAMFRRAKPRFDDKVAAILARLRKSRVIYSDETGIRIDGKSCWNWVFQNKDVVIHVIRHSRGTGVVTEVLNGHRPALWVSDLYGAQQGHADQWQVCLAHQLRNCQFAIEAGDMVFAPRMKAWLLRAVVLARRRQERAEATRRSYRRRLDNDLDKIMTLAPKNRHGQRLRKRYGKIRDSLLTFLEHPEIAPDNNSSERELRPTATYRKVTGGFRSTWGAELFAGIRSVVGTASRKGIDAYQAIRQTLASSYAYVGG